MPSLQPINGRRKIFSRQIPTILGLLVLMVALGAGVLFFNDGFKGFAPRATPETTPKNVKISNLVDTSFSVSFLTDANTTGYVKYGTSATDLTSQAGDDRDQLSGSVGEYTLHHVSVRGLNPSTTYYFVIGTGGQDEFDDEGAPFSITTGPALTSSSISKTIYGNVVNASGGPAEGSIVYVNSGGMGELSALVKSSGSWAVPLNTARTPDAAALAVITDDTTLEIMAQGSTVDLTASATVTVSNAQPVPNLTLGAGAAPITETSSTLPSPDATVDPFPSATPIVDLTDSSSMGGSAATNEVLDLTVTTAQTVTTGQPVIVGVAAPDVVVTLEVHSDAVISQDVQADSDGLFTLDVAALEQSLEPGEHTATYSYVDPTTGQTVTKTQTFTVVDRTLLAQADTSSTGGPFGSGNPFPVATTTPTPTPTPSATATASATPRPTPTPATGSASGSATKSAQTSQPSTGSGMPVSGSTGTTVALIGGGIFFILAGAWSYWVAHNLNSRRDEQ